jgi:membrane dipeptidase
MAADLPLTETASLLHARTLTLDTHIDIPWPPGPSPFVDGPRRVDLPKMRRGGLTAGCFAAYVPQGHRTAAGEQAAFDRASAMLAAIRAIADDAPDAGSPAAPRVADTADAIEAAHADGALAIIPAVENGYSLGQDLRRLEQFRALGACYLTLTHNGHNALGDSANPRSDLGDGPTLHNGLSPLGREAVAELNRLGMLIDVSHVSKATMLQAATLSRTPVVATHSCVRALCDVARNVDDEQLDVIGATGGVVHITAVSSFVRPRARPDAVTVADFVNHIDYAVDRIGIRHVGISSDFDGGGGFKGWHDASDSPNITAELVRRGYGPDDIALLWSGNFLRLLRVAEQAAG